jgi:hypothetical protein
MRVGQFFCNAAESCYNDWNKKERELKARSNSISETPPKGSGAASERETKDSPKKAAKDNKAKVSKEETNFESEALKIQPADSIKSMEVSV